MSGTAAPRYCGCPETDGKIYHQRATCTDPTVAALDWYAEGSAPGPETVAVTAPASGTGTPGQAATPGHAEVLGRAAHVAMHRSRTAREGDDSEYTAWHELDESAREDIGAAVQAVIAKYIEISREAAAAAAPRHQVDPDCPVCARVGGPHGVTAAAAAQSAPASLRADLEETLKDWRDDAKYHPNDTRDEITEHYAVTACANRLADILRDYPQAEQPAPELAAPIGTAWRLLGELRQAVQDLAEQVQASADATRPSKKTSIEDEIAIALRKLTEGK